MELLKLADQDVENSVRYIGHPFVVFRLSLTIQVVFQAHGIPHPRSWFATWWNLKVCNLFKTLIQSTFGNWAHLRRYRKQILVLKNLFFDR